MRVTNQSVDSTGPTARGTLFVVATPIGNLQDLSPRAAQSLREASLILAEDTRHTRKLLDACGIARSGPVESLHEHNERERVPDLILRLQAGARVALVSDAGTPLLSDPGCVLVAAAAAAGVDVVAVPGPCAAIAALSIAGLPTDRFTFEGFLSAKASARRDSLQALAHDPRTLVFYEAPHRLAQTLQDMTDAFGAERLAAVCRELTKHFETVYRGALAGLATRAAADADMTRGETVIVVHGAVSRPDAARGEEEALRVLRTLLTELPVSQAARLAAEITGARRKDLYEHALALAARE
ncbi:MAG: 16S rRNA (cytidine(1402)-2'-O)-methyltransferase [Steroidobacteraceae bacterium]